jgi:hypothetical protein
MVAKMRTLLRILQLLLKILPIIIEAYDQFKPNSNVTTSRVNKGILPEEPKVDSQAGKA